jgi:hypothetical protein
VCVARAVQPELDGLVLEKRSDTFVACFPGDGLVYSSSFVRLGCSCSCGFGFGFGFGCGCGFGFGFGCGCGVAVAVAVLLLRCCGCDYDPKLQFKKVINAGRNAGRHAGRHAMRVARSKYPKKTDGVRCSFWERSKTHDPCSGLGTAPTLTATKNAKSLAFSTPQIGSQNMAGVSSIF